MPTAGTLTTREQDKVSAERGESEGEAGNAGEGEGAARDTERAAEELGDPLPGIPPPHKTVKN